MWWALLACVIAGCGRIHFDVAAHTGDGALDDSHEDPPSEAAIPSGLLVWLRMDDDPTIDSDSSGHGHAAPCVAPCPALVTGRVGSAYRFDGSQQLVVLPYDSGLATPTAFTIAFWFQLDPTTNQVCFTSKETTGDGYSWSIELDTSKAPMVYTGLTPTDDRLYDFTPATVGRWTHLATTWDGTTKRLYIDGVMRSQSTFSAITFDTNDIYLGIQRRINPMLEYYYPLIGSLDEVLIYDRALAPNEIAALAQ